MCLVGSRHHTQEKLMYSKMKLLHVQNHEVMRYSHKVTGCTTLTESDGSCCAKMVSSATPNTTIIETMRRMLKSVIVIDRTDAIYPLSLWVEI